MSPVLEEEESRGRPFRDITIPNVSVDVVNRLAYVIAKIVGKDVLEISKPDRLRTAIYIGLVVLEGTAKNIDVIRSKEPTRIEKLLGTTKQLFATKKAWLKNTSLSQSTQLAREEWIEKQRREAMILALSRTFELMRSLKVSELQEFVDAMEVSLSSIAVKSDERGKYARE
jgi:hypothetical protein